MNIKSLAKKVISGIGGNSTKEVLLAYNESFENYAFTDCNCESYEQFEASITRFYHTIEKGLAYEDYRAGFGENNVKSLVKSMEQYVSKGFDTTAFFYETALSVLNAYVEKNRQHGYEDKELENRIKTLPGKANECGGTIIVSAPVNPEQLTYKELVSERHSIRHFSSEPVSIEKLKKAISLAQYTPSACNRQGWKTRIIASKNKINAILENQNGNRGFGHEFDKLLLITADLRAQQKNREIFQAFIDGGMYAESVINSLYYYGIGSVPLSAALTQEQEKKVRDISGIDAGEVLIMFIGIGNYPEGESLTTHSARRDTDILLL